jgi:hypothetical protein
MCVGELPEFEGFTGQGGLLNGASASNLLAADSGMDSCDSGKCSDKATEGSGPPRELHKVNCHLEGKKRSHAEKAGA